MTNDNNKIINDNRAININHTDDLSWLLAMGVDECISDTPINQYETVVSKPKIIPNSNIETKPTISKKQFVGMVDAVAASKKIANESNSLAELQQAINKFDGCGLKQTAGNTVFGAGLKNADIMIIGGVPDNDDDKSGQVFSGEAGKMLDLILSFIKINRENAYFGNAIYWRPPGRRSPTNSEIAICQPLLLRQIELVSPKILISIGRLPANILFNNSESIKKMHGKWQELLLSDKNIAVMAILDPVILPKNPMDKSLIWADILMVNQKLQQLNIKLD